MRLLNESGVVGLEVGDLSVKLLCECNLFGKGLLPSLLADNLGLEVCQRSAFLLQFAGDAPNCLLLVW